MSIIKELEVNNTKASDGIKHVESTRVGEIN